MEKITLKYFVKNICKRLYVHFPLKVVKIKLRKVFSYSCLIINTLGLQVYTDQAF